MLISNVFLLRYLIYLCLLLQYFSFSSFVAYSRSTVGCGPSSSFMFSDYGHSPPVLLVFSSFISTALLRSSHHSISVWFPYWYHLYATCSVHFHLFRYAVSNNIYFEGGCYLKKPYSTDQIGDGCYFKKTLFNKSDLKENRFTSWTFDNFCKVQSFQNTFHCGEIPSTEPW